MKKIIDRFFSRFYTKQKEVLIEPLLTKNKKINDLKVFDDVYISINDKTYVGWVVEKTRTSVLLSYEDEHGKLQETKFLITNLSDKSIINEKGKKLIINMEDV